MDVPPKPLLRRAHPGTTRHARIWMQRRKKIVHAAIFACL
jgi:hypothetical protein